MTLPRPPEPVKRVVAVLHGDAAFLEDVLQSLQSRWGPIDYQGPDHPFTQTNYYEAEMGKSLCRRWLGFADLMPTEELVAAKLAACDLEEQFSQEGRRQVNLDVGYLDHAKLVLASLKSAGQKLHLGQGVYADLVARFGHGKYQPFEWTFPDLKAGLYDAELAALRSRYLLQRVRA